MTVEQDNSKSQLVAELQGARDYISYLEQELLSYKQEKIGHHHLNNPEGWFKKFYGSNFKKSNFIVGSNYPI